VNPNIPPQNWPPDDDDEIRYDFAGIGYDDEGRIVSVPAGWEVEYTGGVTGYIGGKGNKIEEERVTLKGPPGDEKEMEDKLMEKWREEGEKKLYWGGDVPLELSSFSERAVKIKKK